MTSRCLRPRAVAALVLATLVAAPAIAAAAPARKQLVVVGAGPGGLAAAITARKRSLEQGLDLDVVVLEARGEKGTRKNMIAMARQTLNNLAFLGVSLANGKNVQYLERRTMVRNDGKGRRGPRLAPVRLRPELASGKVDALLRQKNIATMPINTQEAELRRVAVSLGIDVRYHTSVEDVSDAPGGARVTARRDGRTETLDAWMVVMAHGGDRVSDHMTDTPEEPSFAPRGTGQPSLLGKMGVVSRTDATIGSKMLARVFKHTGGSEIRNRFEPVDGQPGRSTHHVRLDGPREGGDTVILSELPTSGATVDHDAWSRRQAGALGITTEPVGPPQEFYLALTSSRDAADPSRSIAVVRGAAGRGGAAGARLLVGESLRKSTPLTGKAAQVALADGIDAGETVAALLEAGGDVRKERALLGRYQRARVRATRALTRAALAEFHESGLTPRPRLASSRAGAGPRAGASSPVAVGGRRGARRAVAGARAAGARRGAGRR